MMKKYEVTIEETLAKSVEVSAENEEEAKRKVEKAYYSGEYILGSENFCDVSFAASEASRDRDEMTAER